MTKEKKTFTIVGDEDILTEDMMEKAGYKKSDMGYESDILIFTGGADIDPTMYGEKRLEVCGFSDLTRDRSEKQMFNFYKDFDKLFIGICRGGQMLNILNGGSLYQHVDNHNRNHKIFDLVTGRDTPIMCAADHHQMMIPSVDGTVLAISKESTMAISNCPTRKGDKAPVYDTEVVWYEDTRSLCWQPHPEWDDEGSDGRNYFLQILEKVTK